jgi:hypothetical protein
MRCVTGQSRAPPGQCAASAAFGAARLASGGDEASRSAVKHTSLAEAVMLVPAALHPGKRKSQIAFATIASRGRLSQAPTVEVASSKTSAVWTGAKLAVQLTA